MRGKGTEKKKPSSQFKSRVSGSLVTGLSEVVVAGKVPWAHHAPVSLSPRFYWP